MGDERRVRTVVERESGGMRERGDALGPTMRYVSPSSVNLLPLRLTNVDGLGRKLNEPSPGPYTAPPAVLVYCGWHVDAGGAGSVRATVDVLVALADDVLVGADVTTVARRAVGVHLGLSAIHLGLIQSLVSSESGSSVLVPVALTLVDEPVGPWNILRLVVDELAPLLLPVGAAESADAADDLRPCDDVDEVACASVHDVVESAPDAAPEDALAGDAACDDEPSPADAAAAAAAAAAALALALAAASPSSSPALDADAAAVELSLTLMWSAPAAPSTSYVPEVIHRSSSAVQPLILTSPAIALPATSPSKSAERAWSSAAPRSTSNKSGSLLLPAAARAAKRLCPAACGMAPWPAGWGACGLAGPEEDEAVTSEASEVAAMAAARARLAGEVRRRGRRIVRVVGGCWCCRAC